MYTLIYTISAHYKLNITFTMEVVASNMKNKNIKIGNSSRNTDEMILLPINYVRSTLGPCNKIYLCYVQLLNHWISVPEDKLAIIRDIILDINTYTAVDDILDSTILRQGIPTAHKIFGIVNTVNAFDFLLCDTLEKVLKLNQPEAVAMYLDANRGTFAGQGIDLYWRENFVCPTEAEYDQISISKTASWLLMLGRLMQLFNSTHKYTETFSVAVGLYFQISDDYNCLTNPKYFASKGFCDDITEGKLSFPIVHAINSHPEEKEAIIDILKQRTEDIEVKKQCLSILEKCGSFEYTLDKLEKLKLIIIEETNKLGDNPYISDLFEFLWETN